MVNANELFKQFFIAIYHHYFTCSKESRIGPSNISDQEKAILEAYFLRFSKDMARSFTHFESSLRIRQIISGIAYFRLEFIPTYLELFPTKMMMNIYELMVRFRMKECSWVEKLQQIKLDMIPDEYGPPGHFWWRKTFEIPEIYLEPADEFRLED
ncbi:hypothetical protein PRIPAC_72588 [Pristionchus pacificus]|uniref:Uncharacterized protein n=1 Tax=Pristionchus pacificus TaxID=54126 RepID=A0A2A6C962_PRIPA|nr:hypothetical protein PRIPAC_72588 [Pristionchus pacificus]|eukprot:PDM74630.1 hypothetical protein PRIPAC_41986 [Pristionchus pacificus]